VVRRPSAFRQNSVIQHENGPIQNPSIVNDFGLHARSAAKLAKLAGEASGGVWIMKNGNTADATSMLDILTLACPAGTEITVSIDDEADLNTLERIAALVRSGFGE
jgi:phosphocarrier protein HPr